MSVYLKVPSKRFKKDVRRLEKSGFDLEKLKSAIDILASGESLPAGFLDHALRGELAGSRECHIGPDWLLRYAKDKDRLLLLLLSTGDHRQVLGIE